MLVTQDGGIPIIGQCLSGNASDNTVFEKRSKALIEQFKEGEAVNYLIADNLKQLSFITRIPDSIGLVGETINKAIEQDDWVTLEDGRMMHVIDVEHYGIKQRWHVLSSETSRNRADKQMEKKIDKESKKIKQPLYHLQAQRFNCEQDAQQAAQIMAKKWTLHQLQTTEIKQHKQFEGRGRPKKDQQPTRIQYQIEATYEQEQSKITHIKKRNAYYVIGSNATDLDSKETVHAYKEQHHVERGFRYLKDPMFFASAFFIKNPKRMIGLVMVMLLALLVYTIAERRLRQTLKELNETLPNQIKKQVQNPTLRWVFQLLEGIHYVKFYIAGQRHVSIDGLNELRIKILRLFGDGVTSLYQVTR